MEEVNNWLNVLNIYKEYYPQVDEDQQSAIKDSINAVFNILPDCDLGMVCDSSQVSWGNQGSTTIQQQKVITLYKRNGLFSRYKDGSGDIDPLLFLLYNPGCIYTKNVASQLVTPGTTIQTREISNISSTIGRSRVKTFRLQ